MSAFAVSTTAGADQVTYRHGGLGQTMKDVVFGSPASCVDQVSRYGSLRMGGILSSMDRKIVDNR